MTNMSSETTEARKQMDDTFKMLKQKDCQPRIQYLPKVSFKNEGELKTFSDKQKQRIPHNQICPTRNTTIKDSTNIIFICNSLLPDLKEHFMKQ